nr:hypothetical protein [Chloroflexota bacterium]
MRRYRCCFQISIAKAAVFLLLAILLIGCSGDTVNQPAPTIIPVAPSRAFPTATKPVSPTTVPPTPTKAILLPPTPTPPLQGVARLTILYTNDTRGYVDPCG